MAEWKAGITNKRDDILCLLIGLIKPLGEIFYNCKSRSTSQLLVTYLGGDTQHDWIDKGHVIDDIINYNLSMMYTNNLSRKVDN